MDYHLLKFRRFMRFKPSRPRSRGGEATTNSPKADMELEAAVADNDTIAGTQGNAVESQEDSTTTAKVSHDTENITTPPAVTHTANHVHFSEPSRTKQAPSPGGVLT